MIAESEIIVRLALAALFGGLVGLERERQNQPAGLRTHIILALGSALAMMISIYIAIAFRPLVLNGDPARLAAQVVSGIGFLGAGAILRYGTSIKGLTTATSLWTIAIVGLAVGAGMYFAALGTTILILLVLTFLNWIEKRFIRTYDTRAIVLQAVDRQNVVDDFQKSLQDLGHEILVLGVSRDVEQNLITFEVVVKGFAESFLSPMVEMLSAFPGVKHFKIQ